MPLSAHLLLAVTALCFFATVHAFPMDGFVLDNQCRCLSTTDSYINPKHFRRLEILPAGLQCRNIEILITLKDNTSLCVNPETEWIQKVITRVIKSKKGVKK